MENMAKAVEGMGVGTSPTQDVIAVILISLILIVFHWYSLTNKVPTDKN